VVLLRPLHLLKVYPWVFTHDVRWVFSSHFFTGDCWIGLFSVLELTVPRCKNGPLVKSERRGNWRGAAGGSYASLSTLLRTKH
jgi:hypothetical protein